MKKQIPINSYKTFQYVKTQLEQEIKEEEENLKQKLASKIPFGLGNAMINPNNGEVGGLKKALTKEALTNGLPIAKKMISSFFKNNNKKFIKFGISAISGIALSIFLLKKIK